MINFYKVCFLALPLLTIVLVSTLIDWRSVIRMLPRQESSLIEFLVVIRLCIQEVITPQLQACAENGVWY